MTHSDWIAERVLDLKARQQAGEHMLCPRCGMDTMKPALHTNALSRHLLLISKPCGHGIHHSFKPG